MENVLAFENRGDWHYVADGYEDLIRKLDEAGGSFEVGADQCDDCGSFDPETGEPGAGFIIREHEPKRFGAFCGCCDRYRPINWTADTLTVFPF